MSHEDHCTVAQDWPCSCVVCARPREQLGEAISHLRSITNSFAEFGDLAAKQESWEDARVYLQAIGETIDHAMAYVALIDAEES